MKKETKTISYVGKEVFIGIDVHKKTMLSSPGPRAKSLKNGQQQHHLKR
jgi:hypothetical protein